MDKVTQQNAANAEESASSSEEMYSQAGVMKEMVTELSSLLGGSASQKKYDPVIDSPISEDAIRTKLMSPESKTCQKELAASPREEVNSKQDIPLGDNDFADF